MPKASFSTPFSHANTAGFRAGGAEFSAGLLACGLTRAADPGQIDWTTVNIPATGVSAGYEIWTFNDALQATNPVVIKFEFGTRFNATDPQYWITVGSGTDGAGNITGIMFDRFALRSGSNAGNTSLPYPSNFCYSGPYFMFVWKRGWVPNANRTTTTAFVVARSVDDTGAPNADGLTFYNQFGGSGTPTSGLTSWSYSYLTGQKLSPAAGTNSYCMIVGDVTNSLVGTTAQVYKHYTRTPRVRPMPFLITVLRSEIPVNAIVPAAVVVGTTPHDYLNLGDAGQLSAVNGVAAVHDVAFAWET